jgi:tetratricopeptide (TPR) repeat protein
VNAVREYLLTDFTREQLVEAIRRPTSTERIRYSAHIPGVAYNFRYADGVAEEIAQRALDYCALKQDSVLPLVQVICAQLYEVLSARTDKVIQRDDFSGFAGGLRKHVGAAVNRLLPNRSDRAAFKKLFTRLYLRQPDGTLTTALLPLRDLAARWNGSTPFEAVTQAAGTGDLRLVRVNSLRIEGEERAYLSLGHDALAPVAAQWDMELQRWSRVRKWAGAFAAVSLVAVAMAGLAAYAYQLKNAAEDAEYDALRVARTSIGAAKDLLNDAPRMDEQQRRVLIDTLQSLKRLQDRHPGDRNVRYELARVEHDLGDMWRELDEFEESERAYERAVGQLEALLSAESGNREYRGLLGVCRDDLGWLLMRKPPEKDLKASQNVVERADREYNRSVELLAGLRAEVNAEEYARELARAYNNLGVLHVDHRGDLEAASRFYRDSIGLYLPLVSRPDAAPNDQLGLARSRANLAYLETKCRHPAEAEQLFRQAVGDLTGLVDQYPRRREYREDLAIACLNFGALLRSTAGPLDEAAKLRERAQALFDSLVKDYPRYPNYRLWVVRCLINQANAEYALRDRDPRHLEEAIAVLEKAVARGRELVALHEGVPEYEGDLGLVCQSLAFMMRERVQRAYRPSDVSVPGLLGSPLGQGPFLATSALFAGRTVEWDLGRRDELRQAVALFEEALAHETKAAAARPGTIYGERLDRWKDHPGKTKRMLGP